MREYIDAVDGDDAVSGRRTVNIIEAYGFAGGCEKKSKITHTQTHTSHTHKHTHTHIQHPEVGWGVIRPHNL